MDSVLGFPIGKASGGEFTGIVKYDARSGRIFRVERTNTGNGYVSENIDITATFKAVFDLENTQTGWIMFPPGAAPSFVLAPLAAVQAQQVPFPAQPSAQHKNGVRFRIKLTKGCAGDGAQVRELAGNATSFVAGFAALYQEYLAQRGKYPGQLPVVMLASAMPVTSSNGASKSTNYQPNWQISGWAPRPQDLDAVVTTPTVTAMPPLPAPMTADDFDAPKTAPVTGGQTVPPPNRMQAAPPVVPQANAIMDDDFG